ncbi:MAG: 6-phosphogluconolactonase [Gemmataceae bacterium]
MVHVYPDAAAVFKAAADLFAEQASKSIAARGRFVANLSGGSTPKGVFELLGQPPYRDQVPWDKVHLWWGDERCVGPDDPKSNYHMTRLAMIDHVKIPKGNVHPVDGTLPPVDGARKYEDEIKQFFGKDKPQFDLIFLGLGDNGHTASLWPDSPVLEEKKRLAAEAYAPEQDLWRVTLTAPILNEGRLIAFLLKGADKADVLKQVLEGPYQPKTLPAQLIKPTSGELRWLVDEAAAAKLSKK